IVIVFAGVFAAALGLGLDLGLGGAGGLVFLVLGFEGVFLVLVVEVLVFILVVVFILVFVVVEVLFVLVVFILVAFVLILVLGLGFGLDGRGLHRGLGWRALGGLGRFGDALQHRLALRADGWVLAEVVEAGPAFGADVFFAEVGCRQGGNPHA